MSRLILSTSATPSTPSSGKLAMYAGTDKYMRYIDDAANVRILTGGPYIDVSANYGLVFDDTTDNTVAYNAMLVAVPDGSRLLHPKGGLAINGTGATISVPSGKHLIFEGAGEDKSWFRTLSQTVDMFTLSDWHEEFIGLSFFTVTTTTTGVQALPVATINVTDTSKFAGSGSCTIVSSTGWQTVAYTGKTATTLTGCSGGGGNTSVGGKVIHRTAGYAINAGSMSYNFVDRCGFVDQFNGILQNATLTGIRNSNFSGTINFSMQFNGANVNGYIDNVTCDGLPGATAHVEVNQCGSLLLSNCDLIRGVQNLRVNPTTPNGCFSIYSSNTFFDTASGSTVKLMGSGNIQRMKFVNCWMSGSVNGLECNSTAATLPTAIDMLNCDIYSNSANGVLWTAGQDFSMSNCRVAGNTTAGVNITAAAGAVTKFSVTTNSINPTAGVGANGTGILVNAGTYGSYEIGDNNVSGNTTANINDGGSVTGFNQKIVVNNLGHSVKGQMAAIVAATGALNTTLTLIVGGLNKAPLPAKSLTIGDMFEFHIWGTNTSTVSGITTLTIRIGTAGTTADAAVMTIALPTSAAAGTTIPWSVKATMTIRTLGAAASVHGTAVMQNQMVTNEATASTGISVFGNQIIIPTFATFSSDVSNYIELCHVTAAATTTNTIQGATIEWK